MIIRTFKDINNNVYYQQITCRSDSVAVSQVCTYRTNKGLCFQGSVTVDVKDLPFCNDLNTHSLAQTHTTSLRLTCSSG